MMSCNEIQPAKDPDPGDPGSMPRRRCGATPRTTWGTACFKKMGRLHQEGRLE